MVTDVWRVGNYCRISARNPLAYEITNNRVVQFRRIQPQFVTLGQYNVINLKPGKISSEFHLSRRHKECSWAYCGIKQCGRTFGNHPSSHYFGDPLRSPKLPFFPQGLPLLSLIHISEPTDRTRSRMP